jgi:hypothetical protein
MDSGDVANYSLARLGRQTIITPGMKNRLNYSFLLRFLPRKTAANIVAGYMKRLYPERSGSVTPQ